MAESPLLITPYPTTLNGCTISKHPAITAAQFCATLWNSKYARTQLFWAVLKSDGPVIRMILENSCSLLVGSSFTTTPHGLYIRGKDRIDPIICSTPLIADYRTGEIVKLVLGEGTSLTLRHRITKKWDTVLHWAVKNTYISMLQLALDKGADPEDVDCSYRTPLHIAALKGSVAMTRVLLGVGADVGAEDIYGYTPLRLVRNILMRGFDGKKMIGEYDLVAVVWLLLENEGNLNWVDEVGCPLLHLAVRFRHMILLKDLLDDGGTSGWEHGEGLGVRVDINVQDRRGATALHVASSGGDSVFIKFLLEKGVNPAIRDGFGRLAEQLTPSHRIGALPCQNSRL